MATHTQHLEEPEGIRMVFQRLCREETRIHLKFGNQEHECLVLAEDPERTSLGITEEERNLWELKPRTRLLLCLEDRGRKFQAITAMEGSGRIHGVECCHVTTPRLLTCMEEWSLADYLPDHPVPCTYTTHGTTIRDGVIRAFGNDGVQLSTRAADGHRGEPLALQADTLLECSLERDIKVLLPCTVNHHAEGYLGLRIRDSVEADPLHTYRAWLSERVWSQNQRDKQEFTPEGVRAKRKEEAPAVRPGTQARMILDHSPLVLVIAEGDAFPQRIAESLGRKFGVATLDYVKGLVKPTLAVLGPDEWGPVKLILVHQRLRVGSGLELTHQLVATEGCPLPILVAGTEEDVSLKRNRAIAAGAVDFISVEPFNVIRVMKALDETLKMFA